MSEIKNLIEDYENLHQVYDLRNTFTILDEDIFYILKVFANDEEGLNRKYMGIFNSLLQKYSYQNYDDYSFDVYQALAFDFIEEKSKEYCKEVASYGIDAFKYFTSKYNKHNVNYNNPDMNAVAFSLAELDWESYSLTLSKRVEMQYVRSLKILLKNITADIKQDSVFMDQLELDLTILELSSTRDLTIDELYVLFQYYYNEMIDELTLIDNLKVNGYPHFPHTVDYTFIRDFDDLKELELWFKLQ
ncbi:MAG: hypothetical protein K9L74_01895 [Candidatus Izimaplasma sp.]|nr:hypothetical protein [Candidatus Izimaplasma bacterium]